MKSAIISAVSIKRGNEHFYVVFFLSTEEDEDNAADNDDDDDDDDNDDDDYDDDDDETYPWDCPLWSNRLRSTSSQRSSSPVSLPWMRPHISTTETVSSAHPRLLMRQIKFIDIDARLIDQVSLYNPCKNYMISRQWDSIVSLIYNSKTLFGIKFSYLLQPTFWLSMHGAWVPRSSWSVRLPLWWPRILLWTQTGDKRTAICGLVGKVLGWVGVDTITIYMYHGLTWSKLCRLVLYHWP